MSSHRRIFSGSELESRYGYARAVVVGERVIVAGTAPVWPDGSCDPDPAAQARRCFEIVSEALARVDTTLEDVVRTRMFVTHPDFADSVGRVHGELFSGSPPAATMVVVAGLLDPRWKTEVEVEAVRTSR
jgi:enamine deaminase RidA (YjgF/YER057c/UK114 family)